MTSELNGRLMVVLATGLVASACINRSSGGAPCVNSAEVADHGSAPSNAAASGTRPAASGASAAANPETIEPKLSFVVRLGATQIKMAEGEASLVRGNFRDPSVSIEVTPERLFAFAGLRFAYPRQFVFEADLASTASQSWVLSGNDLKIMVFRFASPVSLEIFSDGMVKQFGAGTSNAPLNVRLAGADYPARRIEATMAHHEMIMDIISLPSLGERSRFVVLQDSKVSELSESADARALLASTFRIDN